MVPGWPQHWFSFHPNPWISFDFSPRSVAVGAYSLRTYSGAANCGHLKSWALEGSNDSLEWTEVDSQTDSAALNGSSFVGVFRCAGGRPFQVVRLRLTGPNHAGSDFLVLRGIELFGAFQ
jgi:hypothetical protein